MLNGILKDLILSVYSKTNHSIIINSYGRSGSTVLTKSILRSIVRGFPNSKAKLVKSSVSREAWDLNIINLKRGAVFKTHDYPPQEMPKSDFRMLYTFANPIDVITSIKRLKNDKGIEWIKSHLDHLKVPGADVNKIEEDDILGLEKHLNSWLEETRFPIMFLNYENMWNYQAEIGDFLGIKVEFPEFKKRKSNANKNSENYKKLEKTYGSLIQKISELENCFVINM